MNELDQIINKTIEETISILNQSPISEELPQKEEDAVMGTSNVSTATWREGVENKEEVKVLPARSAEQVMGVVVTNGTNSPLKITGTEHLISIGDQSSKSYFIKIEPNV